MSRIYPFQALRPTPDAAARVAAVPYDVVNTDEARALAAGNPISFLHVSRPEIDLPSGIDPHGDAVYEQAERSFAALRSAAPLVVEDEPSFYVYRLTMGAHVQAGVAACFSIDEYEHDSIKKHEKTRPDKEDDRTRHMMAIRAQTGPVFLTYKASDGVDAVVERVTNGASLFDFVAPDRIRHEIWRVPSNEHHHLQSAFGALRRAVHRRRPPSRRQRGARAASVERARRRGRPRVAGVRHSAGRGVSRQSDARVAVSPCGARSQRPLGVRVLWSG